MHNFLTYIGMVSFSLLGASSFAQQPLSLDTAFRISIQQKGISGILLQADGKIIVSGALKFPGELVFSSMARFDPDGTPDNTFYRSGLGGGNITPWQDRFYVGTNAVRRLMITGYLDPTFIEMNSDPLFDALAGGDYHIYPDGRVLLSGGHRLLDSARGFVGWYNLIWFTNTGHLDTTKTHRAYTTSDSRTTDEMEPLANGQFLVFGNGTLYGGQPVDRVFRIHADGSLDTTLHTRITGGLVWSFLPLPDGRFYASGVFLRENNLADTLRLVRFLPNGDLDPTFNNHIEFGLDNLPDYGLGAGLGNIQPWGNGNILLSGEFRTVYGEPRNSICVLDSTGALLDPFDGCGVGSFVYQGLSSSWVSGVLPDGFGHLYVYGAYHGYNDGTTNDTLQRFVTRLYGPDTPTIVKPPTQQERAFGLFPNPASEQVTFTYSLLAPSDHAFVLVRDAVGRGVSTLPMRNTEGQLVLDTRDLAKGLYTVHYTQDGVVLHLDRLIVQ